MLIDLPGQFQGGFRSAVTGRQGGGTEHQGYLREVYCSGHRSTDHFDRRLLGRWRPWRRNPIDELIQLPRCGLSGSKDPAMQLLRQCGRKLRCVRSARALRTRSLVQLECFSGTGQNRFRAVGLDSCGRPRRDRACGRPFRARRSGVPSRPPERTIRAGGDGRPERRCTNRGP